MNVPNALKAKQFSLAAQASERVASLLPKLAGRLGIATASKPDFGDCDGLALWSDQLLHLGSTASAQTTDDAATLAAAAKAFGVTRIALLLPAEEFVSTLTPLPGLAGAAALQALRLQATTLIPSYDEPLALVDKPNRIAGTDDYLCLWMTQARLATLSDAFEKEGVELAAVLPRGLLVETNAAATAGDTGGQGTRSEKDRADALQTSRQIDQDPRQITQVVMRAGAPIKWETLQLSDLEEPELLEQWQAELKSTELAHEGPLVNHSDPAWLSQRRAIPALQLALASGFTFVPSGELKRRQALKNKTTGVVIAAGLLLAALLTLIPFAMQSVQFRLAASELADLRALNDSARQNQAFVADFDSRWGTINEYPQQDIIAALFTLQRVISPDTLTGLEIEEGVVTIEGTSSNPQAILQRLEQDPLFTEVSFSRATSNSRYTIDLRLSNVSFEGYRARYVEATRR